MALYTSFSQCTISLALLRHLHALGRFLRTLSTLCIAHGRTTLMDNHGQILDNVLRAPQTRRTFLRRAGVLSSFATMANLLQMNTADTLITDSNMSRRAKKLDFVPGRDGFHFSNNFTNHLLFGITTIGRCGGMAYAALDYYLAGLPVPTHTAIDFGPSRVPADGTILADYLWWRQIA